MTSVRMPIKAASLAAADQLTDYLNDHGLRFVTSPDSPTQLTVTASLGEVTELLFHAAANQLVTDRSAFTAALSVLTRLAVAA